LSGSSRASAFGPPLRFSARARMVLNSVMAQVRVRCRGRSRRRPNGPHDILPIHRHIRPLARCSQGRAQAEKNAIPQGRPKGKFSRLEKYFSRTPPGAKIEKNILRL
jgi:hypothetical protein